MATHTCHRGRKTKELSPVAGQGKGSPSPNSGCLACRRKVTLRAIFLAEPGTELHPSVCSMATLTASFQSQRVERG